MRKRLIELLLQTETFTSDYSEQARQQAEYKADYLLENDVFVSPVKAGQTVYRVVTMGTGVTFKKVGYNTWREREQTIKRFIRPVTVTKNNFYDIVFGGDFGKTVFLTREEAERALKGGMQE